ncbi:DUF805 domain-containing protein [Aurantiacibacter sp. MUD61]|uniref:DUF805 domain-containing protein n=1 Tax=Aurantiacibacter sp. MUD61 TaxID=3009083 RepID=UPI0022F03A07|nr:DUF805 domain-containing protein [Aurantiacibacter sp. MUD61]
MWWAAIRSNLSRLLKFSGRESKQSFWLYVSGVAIVVIGGGMLAFMPLMAESMARMQEFAEANPDKATIRSGPDHYSITVEGHHPELMPDTNLIFAWLVTFFGLAFILLAAAVARRLHDRGMRGFWGFLPVPFIIFSTVSMRQYFGSENNDMTQFLAIFASNFLYMLSLAVLCILLAGKGDPETNSFGDAPD